MNAPTAMIPAFNAGVCAQLGLKPKLRSTVERAPALK